jgi:hypothetical protein
MKVRKLLDEEIEKHGKALILIRNTVFLVEIYRPSVPILNIPVEYLISYFEEDGTTTPSMYIEDLSLFSVELQVLRLDVIKKLIKK